MGEQFMKTQPTVVWSRSNQLRVQSAFYVQRIKKNEQACPTVSANLNKLSMVRMVPFRNYWFMYVSENYNIY